METKRPGTPEWARKIIAEQKESIACQEKSLERIKELGRKLSPSISPSTSHQNSVTPSFVGFTRSLYSALLLLHTELADNSSLPVMPCSYISMRQSIS